MDTAVAAYPTFLLEDGAACASVAVDPEWFAAEGRTRTRNRQIALARNVCAGCPLTARCARWGRATRQNGVWGGVYLQEGRVSHAA